MARIRRGLTATICLIAPTSLKPSLLRLLGHRVARGVRIRMSALFVDRLTLAAEARIGRFNVITARRLIMRKAANIGHLNWVSGGLSISLGTNGAIGHLNIVNSGGPLGTASRAQLRIGDFSKITTGHLVNVGESISLGNFTTIAGYGSQLWTHGFVHMTEGLARAEVRGRITIGNNVYVGTHCTIQAGVVIENAVSVGAGATVAKSLLEPGTYVPPPLIHLARSPEQRIAALEQRVTSDGDVYYWRDPRPNGIAAASRTPGAQLNDHGR